jgi:DNA-binding XRE family transcriptional regulator
VRLVDDTETDEELVDVFQTDWYRRTKARLTPGKNLRIYRQNSKMTQAQLGKLIALPKQYVSNMENDIRPISKTWQSNSLESSRLRLPDSLDRPFSEASVFRPLRPNKSLEQSP